MIDINELRLNNIIQNQHGELCKVWSLNVEIAGRQKDNKGFKIIGVRLLNDSGKGPVMSNAKGDRFEGVVITEEILLNCGVRIGKNGNDITEFELNDYLFYRKNGGYELFASEWTIGRTFFYLHELQNIYFDLTKLEIPFKL